MEKEEKRKKKKEKKKKKKEKRKKKLNALWYNKLKTYKTFRQQNFGTVGH